MNRKPSPNLRALAAPLLLAALALSSAAGCRAPTGAFAAAPSAAAAPAKAAPLAPDLAAAFARAEREADGHLGVAILHVESGERASYHGAERFPMQSVFKLPLAIEVLARVDAGELRLDEMIHIRPIDFRPGPPHALLEELPEAGGDRPVLELVERVLISSDNTAADALLARLGGPRKVTKRLHDLGFTGIDVSRSEAELMMDFMGVAVQPPRDTWTLEVLMPLMKTTPAARTKALATYLADPRDTATPEVMADLLLRVHRQDLLGKPSAARLVAILERVTTGKDRLRGLLPPGTVVAHKTGTSDATDGVTATVNDVGIVTLPGSGGHVVVAAFLSAARGDDAAQAHAIALVGRAAFDHYAPH
jgi:beta-lactamase class A